MSSWKDPPLELSKIPRKEQFTFYLSQEEAQDIELLRTFWRKSKTDTCVILIKDALERMKKAP